MEPPNRGAKCWQSGHPRRWNERNNIHARLEPTAFRRRQVLIESYSKVPERVGSISVINAGKEDAFDLSKIQQFQLSDPKTSSEIENSELKWYCMRIVFRDSR